MKAAIVRKEMDFKAPGFLGLLVLLGLAILAGLGAAYWMEHQGHWVTGMTNQVVWGLPHVFAIFLIVAASGALNVASVSSVFQKKIYKPLAPFSGLLAAALLAGGLAILVLDLGRPERLIVAMTHYNFKSVFAWNIFLYTGLFAIVLAYLWTMMERRMNAHARPLGILAFLWRLILTTGTGSIFGFLAAREAYDAAIMAPLFVALSLALGTAVFILLLLAAAHLDGRPVGDILPARLMRLLGIFIAATLYFVAAQQVTNLYVGGKQEIVRFLLVEGGVYPRLFWIGHVLLGGLFPLALIFHPATKGSRPAQTAAALLTVLGGFCLLAVIIIGGQAYPLILFPGMEISSSFFDGQVAAYVPSLPEFLLGLGGIAVALLIAALASAFFRFLPESLADDKVEE